jgi:hypothetical protein
MTLQIGCQHRTRHVCARVESSVEGTWSIQSGNKENIIGGVLECLFNTAHNS